MLINNIEIFVKIAEHKSFSTAAELLRLPKSTVSRRIALMEESLEVKLINRTTRHLSLTAIGQAYYEKCLRVLEQLDDAHNVIRGSQAQPTGRLRITMPYELGLFFMPDAINGFLKAFPTISLEVELANRMVDIVEEGIDVALRIGQLSDSSLTQVKFGTMRAGIYASPDFLKNRTVPKHPSELPLEECLQFRPARVSSWVFHDKNNIMIEVIPRGRLIANSMKYICEAAVSALGIGAINTVVATPYVQRQKLIEILSDYKLSFVNIYAVYPSRKFLSPNVRVFIDYIKPRLEAMLGF